MEILFALKGFLLNFGFSLTVQGFSLSCAARGVKLGFSLGFRLERQQESCLEVVTNHAETLEIKIEELHAYFLLGNWQTGTDNRNPI